MCGIVGTLNWGDQAILERMTAELIHRGPDDHGVLLHASAQGVPVGLGSRRLAIQDLSALGHMPMWTPDRQACAVYNGEVYNFRALRKTLEAQGEVFRTGTDTEVILRLYQREGADCVQYLEGMFALAIWDERRQGLFLARDPFGVKPLYYLQSGDRFAFASESKCFRLLPDWRNEVDERSLHEYLTFLWVPEPRTLWRGVEKLPAGHTLWVRPGDARPVQTREYWDLSQLIPPAGDTYGIGHRFAEPDAHPMIVAARAEAVRERFFEVTREQLVGDVPVGAFLSAGLDSSSIVAAMAGQTLGPPKTYTIVIPERLRKGDLADDPAVARRTAEHFGCSHHELVIEPRVVDLLPKLIRHMDDPVADPAMLTAYEVCRQARESATVLLSGVGGDELFGGYRKYVAHTWAQKYQALVPGPIRRNLIEPLVAHLPAMRGTRFRSVARLARKMARSGSLPPQERFITDSTYINDSQLDVLLLPDLRHRLLSSVHHVNERHIACFDRVRHADFLHQMMYVDIKMFMPSLNLLYNDKMSMASSVEVRVPFLDRRLATEAFRTIPPDWNIRFGRFKTRPVTKWLFRRSMAGVLPAEVLAQPKAGFGAPVDHWLAKDLREMVGDLLSPAAVNARGLFRPAAVQTMIAEHQAGARDWAYQIWQLLTLELWYRTFQDAKSA